jgi:dihydrofolate synthase/folylpolyglutamate synthase
MQEGVKLVDWPGRFQVIRHRGRPTVILDVCHNEAGVAAFVETFKNRFKGRKAYIITGFVKRKQHREMFSLLSQIALEFHLVPLKTKRSVDMNELISMVNFADVPLFPERGLRSTYNRLLKKCGNDDIIIIAGSHYLVGEFLEKFE